MHSNVKEYFNYMFYAGLCAAIYGIIIGDIPFMIGGFIYATIMFITVMFHS